MVVLSENWLPVVPSEPSFTDVPPNHPFYSYVETAHSHGAIGGYGDGTFRPDLSVSRAQVAKIVVVSRGWSLAVTSALKLCDVPAGHWAWNYIEVGIAHGIFGGYGDGCFQPDAPATRAQLAKVLVLAKH